jgi:Carboxypeptidase regulatory-like domain
MRILLMTIAILSGLFVPALKPAYATPAALEGTVRDLQWHPIKNATVRIEGRDGAKFLTTVKTDAKGHYWCEQLDAGTYRVTLVVDGIVKASINNAKAVSGESRRLDFGLTGRLGAKATHLVYLPEEKGSHLGGHWVVVDKWGHPNNVSVDNIQTLSRFQGSDTTGLSTKFMHVNGYPYEDPVGRAPQ